MRTFARMGLAALVAYSVGTAIFADGDTRVASPGEKACAGKTLGVLCGAIPPPAAG